MMHHPDKQRDDSTWPFASLLFFGFFGSDTPAGRRLARRTTAALVVFVVAAVALTGALPLPLPDSVWVLAMPAAVFAIAWEHGRYLNSLDELGRLIQLKAFAFSYGVAMVFAFGLLALGLADTVFVDAARRFLPLIALVEGLRGVALVHLARKYA